MWKFIAATSGSLSVNATRGDIIDAPNGSVHDLFAVCSGRCVGPLGRDLRETRTTRPWAPSRPPARSSCWATSRLEGWVKADGKTPANWPFADGILTVGHGDIMTEKTFGNFELHVEFNVPYMPEAHGQGRGNSGVYLTGNHELQVLDSYGLKIQDNECGAIYHQVTPAVNACKPPLQWQTYDITFHKAKLERRQGHEEGPRDRLQNGIKIIDNAEISPTPGGIGHPRRQGRPDPAPGPRQSRPVSQHLDQADRLSIQARPPRLRDGLGCCPSLTPEGCAARRERLWQTLP